MRLIVADDDPSVRKRIRVALEKHKATHVVGEAADSQEALELVKRFLPDVLVMSLEKPYTSGMETLERIHALGVRTQVVILSASAEQALVERALKRGASGYVLKCCLPDELMTALCAAQRGDTYLSPEIAESLTSKLGSAQNDVLHRLTSREHEVLQLIVRGETNRSIARKLGVSEKTVEKHRSSLMAKLDAHNIADLICSAIRSGLVLV